MVGPAEQIVDTLESRCDQPHPARNHWCITVRRNAQRRDLSNRRSSASYCLSLCQWTWVAILLGAMGLSAGVQSQSDVLVMRVDVEDRSELTIDLAAAKALRRVLLQHSGDPALLTDPAIQKALASARSQLALYQFERVEGRIRFVAHIDRVLLEGLIREANGTVWAGERPPVFLWLVIDDANGRRFGNTEAEQPLWVEFEAAFSALGLNLRRPLYDLTDATLVSPDTLWRRDYGPVVEASARYGMTHLLVGRLISLSGDRTIAEWTYLQETAEQSVSIQADTHAALIEPGLAMTMAEMRRLFAVELKTEAVSQPLMISIKNVVSLADYQAVTQLVSGIQTLGQVRPIAVEGEILRLALFGVEDADSLIRLMASQTELQWVNTNPDADGGLLLSWQGS